jgi:carboxypeptidase D
MMWESFMCLLIGMLCVRMSVSRRIPPFTDESAPVSSTSLGERADRWFSDEAESDHIARETSAVSAEDHLVTSLPGLDTASFLSKQYAGLLPVDGSDKSFLFYWLFEADEKPEDKPLVIWMNGGPGCSSMDGLFLELGPLRVDPGGKAGADRVSVNPHGWHHAANILFLDQPVGTGFAYTKSSAYCRTDQQINDHFYYFLKEFFRLHPQYTRAPEGVGAAGPATTRPLYLAGESHAGHYIPYMAEDLLRRNADGARTLTVDLRGAALGNPWTDPFTQYDVSDFMHGLGLLTHGQKNKCKETERVCQAALKRGHLSEGSCYGLLDKAIAAASDGHVAPSMYDTRRYVSSQSQFPPGKHELEAYLNRADVRAALHTTSTPQKFVECADPPYLALQKQDGKGATAQLAAVLNAGVKVVVYVGQFDVICNHLGVEKMLEHLDWQGRSDWLLADNFAYSVGGQPVGYIKAHKNLGFMTVLNAGHMVPMDQPAVTLDLMQRFVGPAAAVEGMFASGGKRQLPMSLVDTAAGADCEPAVTAKAPASVTPVQTKSTPPAATASGSQSRLNAAVQLLGGLLLLSCVLIAAWLGCSRVLCDSSPTKSAFSRRGDYRLASTVDQDVGLPARGRRPTASVELPNI